MPIILKNSHSHAFSYTGEDGVRRDVTVLRGQDIEPLGIPQRQLLRIMNEYVVTFDGSSERPRYEVQEEPMEEQSTYNAGPTTQALVTKSLQKDPNDPAKKPLTQAELIEMQRAAEMAEFEENQRQYDEQAQLAAAESERVAREAAEATERAEAAEARTRELEAKLAAADAATAAKAEAPAPVEAAPAAEVKKGPGRPAGSKNK